MAINASNPVVAPAVGSITYNQWYMTQLVSKLDATSAPTIVHLRRSATVNGAVVLMPNDTPNAEVVISVDAFIEAVRTPELAVAIQAITTAIIAYATKKNLI